jgi:hypothetical protein
MTSALPALGPFALWIFSLLLLLSPPEKREAFQRGTDRPIPAEQRETSEEGRVRYAQIARDLDEVLSAPDAPRLFRGSKGKARTAALVLAVAYLESGFRKDVDLGEGKLGRGDHGRSFCLMQIQTGKGAGTVPATDPVVAQWTGNDLVKDRKKCLRAGLAMLAQSLGECRLLKDERDRLSAYTTGTCRDDQSESRVRWGWARRIFALLPPPAPSAAPAPLTLLPAIPVSPSGPAGPTGHMHSSP